MECRGRRECHGLTAAVLAEGRGGAALWGCVTIQARTLNTKASAADAEARMADQFIRLGSPILPGGVSNQGVEREKEAGNGGGVEVTA